MKYLVRQQPQHRNLLGGVQELPKSLLSLLVLLSTLDCEVLIKNLLTIPQFGFALRWLKVLEMCSSSTSSRESRVTARQ